MSAPTNITQLLASWSSGDQAALEALTPLVHQELHRLAARYMAGERPGHILQPTALVNEAYLRLVDWKDGRWQNRAHFFAVAAQIMRRVLVDVARTRDRAKRGRGQLHVSLSEAADVPVGTDGVDLVALDDALKTLEGTERAAEPRRRAALLRRTEPGGSGARAQRVGGNRETGLEPGAGLALPRAEQRRMNPERYEKVGQLFHAALELPRDERSAFLSGACGADEDLRQEVESLLAAHEKAGDFVAGRAMNVAAEWLAREEEAGTSRGRIGAYEVLSLVGRGGMGEVYLAHDTRLGRNVAVKLLRSVLTSNADAVRRFEQEARAASSLNHPNIVTIYEIGDLLERRFLAMELVEGQSLAAMVGRPVDVAALARIGAQLARALSVAHAAGIVHRDIKPENVMVREDGYVKVLDFGLARLAPLPTVAGRTATPTTNPSLILGTPRYMSPEQARGETATSASDVFSLGVVFYELATGTHPFESESTLGTLHAITSNAVHEPRAAGAGHAADARAAAPLDAREAGGGAARRPPKSRRS